MLRHVAVAEMSHVSILALLLYCNSGPSFVSPSRVRLMHCTLRSSVIQKKSLSLDPQGALMVALLQNRWQQPFIKSQWLLSLVNCSAIIAQTHAQPNPHISVKSYMCPQTYCLIHSYGLCTLKHKHIHTYRERERERERERLKETWGTLSAYVCFVWWELWAHIHSSSRSTVPPEAASSASFSSPSVQLNSSTQKQPQLTLSVSHNRS